MLMKLFKHEWKDSWKLMTVLCVVVVALSALGAILFHDYGTIMDRLNMNDSDALDMMFAVGGMGYVVLLFMSVTLLLMGSTIYFYVRFYRNLYTDQGYLMHTLPVSKHELILSKTFVYVLWKLIAGVIIVVSACIMFFSIFGEEFTDAVLDVIREVTNYMDPWEMAVAIPLLLIMSLLRLIMSAFTGYMSISIGQLAVKNKVFASIGVFIGIRIVLRLIINVLIQSIAVFDVFDGFEFIKRFVEYEQAPLITLFVGDIIACGICAAMYWIIYSIMNKSLNLD